MADLVYAIYGEWSGSGKAGEGTIVSGGQTILYSAPANMGGKGVGTSPEELLLAAVSACYSGTLFRVLEKAGLPVTGIRVGAEGTVENYPTAPRFRAIRVMPTIQGGDSARQAAYQEAAERARDRCFIGKTVRDALEYTVGAVVVDPVSG